MIGKTVFTLALTTALVGGTSGVAAAHECYIPNRSEQGNAGASKSPNWSTFTLADIFSSAHLFLETNRPLTAAEVEQAVNAATAQGIPTSVTVFERFTLPRSVQKLEEVTSKSSDGKGIDHFFTAYGDDVIGIYFDIAFPE